MKPDEGAPPVHTVEVIGRDGTRAKALRVFCPSQARSLDLEQCARCSRLRTLPEDPHAPGARITCSVSALEPPSASAPDSIPSFATLAASASVGDIMGARVTCVRPEVDVTTLDGEFGPIHASLLPVVDDDAKLLGVLWRHDLAPPRMHESIALRVRLRVADRDTVADQLDPFPLTLHEGAPAIEALRAMTVDHARSIAVVGDGGRVVGTLSDLELLTWFARARRGFLP